MRTLSNKKLNEINEKIKEMENTIKGDPEIDEAVQQLKVCDNKRLKFKTPVKITQFNQPILVKINPLKKNSKPEEQSQNHTFKLQSEVYNYSDNIEKQLESKLLKDAGQIGYNKLNTKNENDRINNLYKIIFQERKKNKIQICNMDDLLMEQRNELQQIINMSPQTLNFQNMQPYQAVEYASDQIEKVITQKSSMLQEIENQDNLKDDHLLKAFVKQQKKVNKDNKLSELQKARLILKFLRSSDQPSKNRQFYQYFFNQQRKAQTIQEYQEIQTVNQDIMQSVQNENSILDQQKKINFIDAVQNQIKKKLFEKLSADKQQTLKDQWEKQNFKEEDLIYKYDVKLTENQQNLIKQNKEFVLRLLKERHLQKKELWEYLEMYPQKQQIIESKEQNLKSFIEKEHSQNYKYQTDEVIGYMNDYSSLVKNEKEIGKQKYLAQQLSIQRLQSPSRFLDLLYNDIEQKQIFKFKQMAKKENSECSLDQQHLMMIDKDDKNIVKSSKEEKF